MSVSYVLPGSVAVMSEKVGEEVRLHDGEDGRYWYEIHSSGALVIWLGKGGESATTEAVYGPGAWIRVSGDRQRH
jgi:hypothetical protein